ncbi:glucosaminidase domain-containing protein [Paraglaciecola marina]|uniref:glucosaminidase domain-containing protein n=1 Tax=Paraglaciecola marina TaxID=2500157 RepID=UPI0010623330|nr:glucosaminidase domain-containing protein [Paraglaciecola marina]
MLKNLLSALVILLLVVTFIVVTQQNHIDKKSHLVVNLKAFDIPVLESDKDPVPDFNTYENVIDKKKAFFAYLLPEVKRQNTIITIERQAVITLFDVHKSGKTFNKSQKAVFEYLVNKYTVQFETLNDAVFDELKIKIDVIPEALVLVQGAIESGWGTSRFARQGYNFFGLWCFKEGCGFVPKQRIEGAVHEVAKFSDLSHAVMTYMRNINRLYAYEELRALRLACHTNNKPVTADVLANGLISYSERGQEYIDELLDMLRVNKKHMGLQQ